MLRIITLVKSSLWLWQGAIGIPGNCQNVIDKWKKISDEQSAEIDQKLKDNPLGAQIIDKEVAKGGYDMTQRPGWLGNIGAEVMTSDEAKAYVQQWNGRIWQK